ncbi:Predicted RNA-binding protein, contains PUA-like domain [Verrucomicrobium sp. GAS474]|uniref:EVE domain-containing protein n=1 Tax=Verrucomicrobium sp. GAS474 TaxID=1882831 RepID=UPI000879BB52|nr:EVE domain-containing protein [Verrucomicrobium sp. GAS474]SDT89768.1 Predicted RNA-binding protein, contains PUA-like domain [Verrucomicrobium sp. GAS474]
MASWLVKQEPTAYAFATFQKEKETEWTGVRNFQARNNLRAMKKGDRVFYYHSVEEKRVVGLATVAREAHPDTTATEGDWSCVTLKAGKALPEPVTLEAIKGDPLLKEIALVRQSRLSVVPLTEKEADRLAKLGGI